MTSRRPPPCGNHRAAVVRLLAPARPRKQYFEHTVYNYYTCTLLRYIAMRSHSQLGGGCLRVREIILENRRCRTYGLCCIIVDIIPIDYNGRGALLYTEVGHKPITADSYTTNYKFLDSPRTAYRVIARSLSPCWWVTCISSWLSYHTQPTYHINILMTRMNNYNIKS